MSKAKIELLHENIADYLCSESVVSMLESYGNSVMSTLPKKGYHSAIITWTKYPRTRRKVLKLYVRGYKAERLERKSNRLLKAAFAGQAQKIECKGKVKSLFPEQTSTQAKGGDKDD